MLDLLGTGRSLMQQTLERVAGDQFGKPIILGNVEHAALIQEQLAQISMDADILLEPEARNTAPAIALACAFAQQRNENSKLLVLPSDHVVTDETAFLTAVANGAAVADDDHLITFGITPHKPETGFGYIEMGATLHSSAHVNALAQFVEKPNLQTAQGYIKAGNFVWNAGMFLFSVTAVTRAFEADAPACLAAAKAALAEADIAGDVTRPNSEAFRQSPKISFDYAIMESTKTGAVVPCDIGWSDVGSFEGLWEVLPKDASGNAVIGDVTLIDCEDCLAFCDGPAIAITGLSGQVVISTSDVTTVLPKEQSQNVKALRQLMEDAGRAEATTFLA